MCQLVVTLDIGSRGLTARLTCDNVAEIIEAEKSRCAVVDSFEYEKLCRRRTTEGMDEVTMLIEWPASPTYLSQLQFDTINHSI